jgi:hypothetical protein
VAVGAAPAAAQVLANRRGRQSGLRACLRQQRLRLDREDFHEEAPAGSAMDDVLTHVALLWHRGNSVCPSHAPVW